jgi:hypothetical protein
MAYRFIKTITWELKREIFTNQQKTWCFPKLRLLNHPNEAEMTILKLRTVILLLTEQQNIVRLQLLWSYFGMRYCRVMRAPFGGVWDRSPLQIMRSAFERLINRRARTSATDGAILISRRARRKKRSGSKRAETAERASGSKYPSPSIYLSLSRWDIWWHGTGEIWWENSHSSEHIGRTYHYVCWRSVGRLIHSAAFGFATVLENFFGERALWEKSVWNTTGARESNVLIENVKSTASRKSKGKKQNAPCSGEKYFALLSFNQKKHQKRLTFIFSTLIHSLLKNKLKRRGNASVPDQIEIIRRKNSEFTLKCVFLLVVFAFYFKND